MLSTGFDDNNLDFSLANKPSIPTEPVKTTQQLLSRIEQVSQLAQWSAGLTGKCLANQQALYSLIASLTDELKELQPGIQRASEALATIEAVELRLQQVAGKQLNEIDLESLRTGITDAIASGKIINKYMDDIDNIKAAIFALSESMSIPENYSALGKTLKTLERLERRSGTRKTLSPETKRLIDS